MDSLILKYLLNDLSLEEQHELSKWLEQDEANKQILQALTRYWDSQRPNLDSQREEVLTRIKREISLEPVSRPRTVSKRLFQYARYAAVFVLACAVAVLLHRGITHSEDSRITLIEKTALPGQLVSFTLPDGSSVKLNGDSKLTVPEKFDGHARKVKLAGEAFFDIQKDPERPFTIELDGSEVTVKGTSFNVRAYTGEDQLVAVKHGVVSVQRDGGKTIELEKQQMSILSINGARFEKQPIENDDMVFGWMERKLVFQSRSLRGAMNVIERWYDVKIDMVRPVNTDKRYTATHDNNPSLEEVMESMSYVFDFKYKIDGKRIIIK